jgi:hypothetical protein
MLLVISTTPGLHRPHNTVQDRHLHVDLLLEATQKDPVIHLHGRTTVVTALRRLLFHLPDRVQIAMDHIIVLPPLVRLVVTTNLRYRLHLGHQLPLRQCQCQRTTDQRRWVRLCFQRPLDHAGPPRVGSTDLHETFRALLYDVQILPIARHPHSVQALMI